MRSREAVDIIINFKVLNIVLEYLKKNSSVRFRVICKNHIHQIFFNITRNRTDEFFFQIFQNNVQQLLVNEDVYRFSGSHQFFEIFGKNEFSTKCDFRSLGNVDGAKNYAKQNFDHCFNTGHFLSWLPTVFFRPYLSF